MSSFDKTMRFEFQEDPMEHDVKEVMLHVLWSSPGKRLSSD